jgi:iron complex outermembrane recepter protein
VQGAPRDPISASSTLVTAREIAAAPHRSAEDALRLVPGVTVVQHGSEGKGYQFLVRGFDAQHGADFAVSADGVPLNEWSNVHAQGYLDLGFVMPELISAVHVTKGPFTLKQGAFAMAGSADYHLGVAERDRGLRAAYTVGSTNRHRGLVTYSPRDGDGHDFIASETLHDDGFGSRRGVSKGTLLARRELMHSASSGDLSVLAGGYLARFELPGALRTDDFEEGRIGFRDSYTKESRGASQRALLALTYEKRHGGQVLRGTAWAGLRRLEVFENFTGYLYDRESGDFRLQRHDTLNFGASFAFSTQLLKAIDGHVGLGITGDALDQQQWHTDIREQPLVQERGLDALQTLTHALGGFTLRPHAKLRLDAGARLDVAHVRTTDELAGDAKGTATLPVVSPRASLEWRTLPQLRLLAAYGRGFRPPEARAFSRFEPAEVGFDQDVFDGGEPAMTTTDSFELGARYGTGSGLQAQLSLFATYIARESVYDHVSGVNVELNGTRRLGTELSLRATPTPLLTLGADVTALDARFVASDNPVPLAPTLFGSARALLGDERGPRAGLRLLAIAPRPLPHGARSSTLTQLDATAGYSWETWRLDLEAENLLNQQLAEAEYHFASHWRLTPASNVPALHYVAGPPPSARVTLTAVF